MTDPLTVANVATGMITSMRAPARGRTHWAGVVKVQRSITPGGQVLIYDERRTILHKQAMPPELERLFLPDEWKFYADATYDNGLLKVNNRTGERDW